MFFVSGGPPKYKAKIHDPDNPPQPVRFPLRVVLRDLGWALFCNVAAAAVLAIICAVVIGICSLFQE